MKQSDANTCEDRETGRNRAMLPLFFNYGLARTPFSDPLCVLVNISFSIRMNKFQF